MDKRFPIKLWLLSIILGPTLMSIWGLWFSDFNWVLDDLSMYFIFIIVGALLSTPALAVCYLVYILLSRKGLRAQKVKIATCLLSLLGVWVTFIFSFGWESFTWSGNRSGIIYSIIYSVSILLAALAIHFLKKVRMPSPEL